MATSSVGATGRNYPNLQAWEDALTDPFTEDEIAECYDDAEFVGSTDTPIMTFAGVDTSTFRAIIRPATGEGFAETGSAATTALRYPTAGVRFRTVGTGFGRAFDLGDQNIELYGLAIQHVLQGSADGAIRCPNTFGWGGWIVDSCLIELTSGASRGIYINGGTSKVVNSAIIDRTTAGAIALWLYEGADCYNNTIVRPSNLASGGTGIKRDYGTVVVSNTVVMGFATTVNNTISATSDYNVTDSAAPTNWGSNSLASQVYADQFEAVSDASGTHDFRLKTGSDCEGAGTPDATNTGGVDIIGQTRDATTPDIGCWEFVGGGGAAATPRSNPFSGAFGGAFRGPI